MSTHKDVWVGFVIGGPHGKLLIVDSKTGKKGFPGGRLKESDISLLAGAKRELKEEAYLKIKDDSQVFEIFDGVINDVGHRCVLYYTHYKNTMNIYHPKSFDNEVYSSEYNSITKIYHLLADEKLKFKDSKLFVIFMNSNKLHNYIKIPARA